MKPNSGKRSSEDKVALVDHVSKVASERMERNTEKLNPCLTVRGSSAPMHAQRSKSAKESGTRTFRRCRKVEMRIQPPLPMDNIILLAERLELTHDRDEFRKRKSPEQRLGGLVPRNETAFEDGSQLPPEFSTPRRKKHSDLMSSDLNFAIDLSSLSDASDDSVESCGRFEGSGNEEPPRSSSEKKDVGSLSAGSPRSTPFGPRECRGPSVRVCDAVCSSLPDSRFPLEGNTIAKTDARSDSICLYVNAVNNRNDIIKYFRPCPACKETCCLCRASQLKPPSSRRICGDLFDSERSDCRRKHSQAVETDAKVTRFWDRGCECINFRTADQKKDSRTRRPFPSGRSCSERSTVCSGTTFLAAEDQCGSFYCSQDCCLGCASTLDSGRSGRRADVGAKVDFGRDPSRLVSYASSLASAARSARMLAEDLDSILNIFKN